MIKISSFKTVRIYNSTVISVGNLYIDNFKQDCSVSIVNTLLDLKHIVTNSTVYNKSITVSLSQVALRTTATNLVAAQTGYGIVYLSYAAADIQQSLELLLSADSPDSATNINYLDTKYSGITLSGDSNYTSDYEDWYNGDRDGIGALYFEAPDLTLSASVTQEYPPFASIIGLPETSANIEAENYVFNFGDGYTSASTTLYKQHIYETPGLFYPTVILDTKNGWNEKTSVSIGISALDSTLSTTLGIFDSETEELLTTGSIYRPLMVSGSYIGKSGLFSKYTVDLNDGTAEVEAYSNPIEYEFEFTTAGTYNVTLEVTNSIGQAVSATTTFIATPVVSATYYVNISDSYTDTDNDGSLADPFNWDEFVEYLETNGTYYDTYKLKGLKTITSTDVNTAFVPITPQANRHFLIEDWDASVYGPWVIKIVDYDDANKVDLDFSNCTLKNGIIYNVPFPFAGTYYGGTLRITNAYDVYVVMQGTGCNITLTPDHLDITNLYGCTMYSEDGFADDNATFTANLIDSVVDFKNKNYSYFQNSSINNYNNCFVNTESYIDTYFTISNTSGCQYGWTPPTNYPFKRGCRFYNESLDYIIQNKHFLKPFSGITAPPNPGQGWDTYPGYSTGLFKTLRKDYPR